MSIQVKGDLNEANRDQIAYKKWELKYIIKIIVTITVLIILALPFIYKPLLG